MAAKQSPHTMDHRLLKAVGTGDADLLAQILGVWSVATAEEDNESFLQGVTVDGSTALHIAAYRGYLELVVMIHTHDSSLIRVRNNRLDTPLICAARAGHVDVVDYLMMRALAEQEAGYLVLRAWNSFGATAMHEAIRNGHAYTVQKLMSRDIWLATMVDGKGFSPLYLAIVSNHADMIEILIKGLRYAVRSPASYVGPDGKTALHAAVYASRAEEISKFLLSWEPSLGEKTDSSGKTALHYAAAAGKVGLVKLLLGNSLLGYVPDNDGLFPIHVAALAGNGKVIRMFMEICPSSDDLLDQKHRNVLHCAVEHGHVNVVWHILRKNAAFVRMLHAVDSEGNTPLHLAVKHGHAMIFYLLTMQIRMNFGILNHGGLTPQQVALNEASRNYSFSAFKHIYMHICLRYCEAYPGTLRDLTGNLDLEEEKESSSYPNVTQNMLCISALIAACTFAAALTPPGGYNDEGVNAGKPVLGDQVEFLDYVKLNSLSFVLSTSATCMLVHASPTNIRIRARRNALTVSVLLVYLAVLSMLYAFVNVIILTLEPEKHSDHYTFYVIIRLARELLMFFGTFPVLILVAPVLLRILSRSLWKIKQMFKDKLKLHAAYYYVIISLVITSIGTTLYLVEDLFDMQDSDYVYPT